MRAGLAPSRGTTVGPFRLVARLGGGDDTDVWRADGDGIIVALKVLRDPTDVLAVARMAREAAALQRIEHPHVVTMFDVGDDRGEPYLATPLLDGGTLGALLDHGLISPEIACATLAPIAEALAACHAVGVVHRDVKPSNVILATDGPLLIDFGAAALDGVTLDGWIAGAAASMLTPKYAAPDVTPSSASDVYSLGVVLVEAVCGSSEMYEVPGDFSAFVAGCVHPDAARRPSMAVVAREMRSFANGQAPACVAAAAMVDDAVAQPEARLSNTGVTVRTGREFELARLVDEFDASVAASEMRATLVLAPPGAGKTWLFDAAAQRVATHDALVLRASCSEAVGDVRALSGWVRRVGTAAQIAALIGDHHASVLLHAVGLASGSTSNADAAAIAEALGLMLASCGRPVAMIDDLHHGSPDMIEVLARLSFRPGINGVLWMSARPGHLDPDDLDVQTITLGPLDDDVIIDLAGAEAVELAGGNPLLARELAHAREAGAQLGDDVQAMIGARLDRLDLDARGDLAVVAACGEVFWPETLNATQSLGSLCRAGVVRVRVASEVSGSTEAEWVHPLLREVAYSRLDTSTRRDAHLDVARKLDAVAVDVELVAHHAAIAFESGADAAEFVASAAARACRVALDRFALANADRWTTLLGAVGVEPARGATDTLRAELLLRRGEYVESAQLADGWIAQDDEVGTRALALSAEAHLATGETERSVERGARAIDRIADSLWRDTVRGRQALALSRLGDYDRAIQHAEAARMACVARGDSGLAAQMLARLGVLRIEALAAAGRDPTAAIDDAQEALRELKSLGDLRSIADAAHDLADAISVVDLDAAQEVLATGLAAAQKLGDSPLTAAIAQFMLGMAIDRGDRQLAGEMMAIASVHAGDFRQRSELEVQRLAIDLADHGPLPATMDAVRRASGNAPKWAITVRVAGIALPLWFGRITPRAAIETLGIDPVLRHMLLCSNEVFVNEGWAVPPGDTAVIPVANELALLALLRGDGATADALLRQRHEFLATTGSTHQRYNQYFSGALVAALGPNDTEPRLDWLVGQIVTPAFPMMWAMHRALCAILLVERGDERAQMLLRSARHLIDRSQPDPSVRKWVNARLQRAAQI